jgi:hypothetical protein
MNEVAAMRMRQVLNVYNFMGQLEFKKNHIYVHRLYMHTICLRS